MHLKRRIFLILSVLLLTGCGTITYERARFDGDYVSNPTFGRGVYYQLPAGYSLLNPRSPVPPKPENARFERFLRHLAVANDEQPGMSAFKECLLFRSEDRYLMLFHISANAPITFKNMHPGNRRLLLPEIAAFVHRRFDTPTRDFSYTFEERAGRTLIAYAPFQPDSAGASAIEWRGVGYSIIGDLTDITYVLAFAREHDVPAARADLNALLARYSYGKPLAPR